MLGSSCKSHWGIVFWTAGRRINPSRKSSFVWQIPTANGHYRQVLAMTYTNWYPGQPSFSYKNEYCMFMRMRAGTWCDYICNSAYCSICEVDMWVLLWDWERNPDVCQSDTWCWHWWWVWLNVYCMPQLRWPIKITKWNRSQDYKQLSAVRRQSRQCCTS